MKIPVKILDLHYLPDFASAAILIEELAVSLSGSGFAVEVLTSQPIYDTKRKSHRREITDGVNIERIGSLGIDKSKKIAKILNSLWYCLNVFIKLLIFPGSKKAVYVFTTNPPVLILLGPFLKYFRHIKYTLLIYDINPDASTGIKYANPNSMIVKIWKYLNKSAYKNASAIITISDAMKEYIKKNYCRNTEDTRKKIIVIHNWADKNFINPQPKRDSIYVRQNKLENKFLVLYAGNIGICQKFDGLLEASLLLRDKDIAFVFFGEGKGKKEIVDFKVKKNLLNYYFFEYQEKKELPSVFGTSDLSVVHLERDLENFCMPSKLYYILASGRPILAFCSEDSELARIINDAECGYSVTHKDPRKITEIILTLKNDTKLQEKLGRNSRNYFLEHYDINKSVAKYENVLKSVYAGK